jgi:hypothetical protein
VRASHTRPWGVTVDSSLPGCSGKEGSR